MGNGRKNYFRHSMNAFEDEKIQRAIELLGIEGYAYFFIILELVAKQCADGYVGPVKIHKQTLRLTFRKQYKGCNKVLEKLQESDLLKFQNIGGLTEISIPNLAKYLGRYDRGQSKSPAKSKSKELAKALADKIYESLSKFSNSSSNERRDFLGTDGLEVCEALGGWSQLAFSNTIPKSYMRKHLFDACVEHFDKQEVEENDHSQDG